MFAILEAADALDRRFAGIPAGLLTMLEAKARELGEALTTRVRDEKLSGQALQSKSGALKASIAFDVSIVGAGVTATVGSFGDLKYAAIQEFGGRTAAHEILPAKARALAFMVGGDTRFGARVQHPGSSIPAHGYLSSSLEESRDAIVAGLAQAATQAWSA